MASWWYLEVCWREGYTIEDICIFSFTVSLTNIEYPATSYHLLWGGSLLLSFSVFMLSLAKPDSFYQVRPYSVFSPRIMINSML
jgi:hypothetical protein